MIMQRLAGEHVYQQQRGAGSCRRLDACDGGHLPAPQAVLIARGRLHAACGGSKQAGTGIPAAAALPAIPCTPPRVHLLPWRMFPAALVLTRCCAYAAVPAASQSPPSTK